MKKFLLLVSYLLGFGVYGSAFAHHHYWTYVTNETVDNVSFVAHRRFVSVPLVNPVPAGETVEFHSRSNGDSGTVTFTMPDSKYDYCKVKMYVKQDCYDGRCSKPYEAVEVEQNTPALSPYTCVREPDNHHHDGKLAIMVK